MKQSTTGLLGTTLEGRNALLTQQCNGQPIQKFFQGERRGDLGHGGGAPVLVQAKFRGGGGGRGGQEWLKRGECPHLPPINAFRVSHIYDDKSMHQGACTL